MELIDVNALWDALFPEGICGGIYGHGTLGEIINNQPTVADLVFCKDCKYWGDEAGIKEIDGKCYARCNVHNHYIGGHHYGWCPSENDFCSYGEPKEE